jgi:hypothetical protein
LQPQPHDTGRHSGGVDQRGDEDVEVEYRPHAVKPGSASVRPATRAICLNQGSCGRRCPAGRVPRGDRDTAASARRFAARCGNEPRPIWIDNYLYDAVGLEVVLPGDEVGAGVNGQQESSERQ